jgi:DnaJ-class molecular chaperone
MKARQCPWCHGSGGYVEVIFDGQGPLEECAMCLGKGELKSKKLFYQCLGWLSGLARMTKRKP